MSFQFLKFCDDFMIIRHLKLHSRKSLHLDLFKNVAFFGKKTFYVYFHFDGRF